jgi:hypothetical protein
MHSARVVILLSGGPISALTGTTNIRSYMKRVRKQSRLEGEEKRFETSSLRTALLGGRFY